jgi:hypothetical protein
MVLTKDELIATLRNEICILLHLAGKVDRAKLDYRPTPTQRTTLELLQYMAIMGPTQIVVIKGGVFNRAAFGAAWQPAEAAAAEMTFDQAIAAIEKQSDGYARELGEWTEADFRSAVNLFGTETTRGAMLVTMVINGHAAYRTQLFCYLKSCGRDELGTMDLWAGADSSSKK